MAKNKIHSNNVLSSSMATNAMANDAKIDKIWNEREKGNGIHLVKMLFKYAYYYYYSRSAYFIYRRELAINTYSRCVVRVCKSADSNKCYRPNEKKQFAHCARVCCVYVKLWSWSWWLQRCVNISQSTKGLFSSFPLTRFFLSTIEALAFFPCLSLARVLFLFNNFSLCIKVLVRNWINFFSHLILIGE